MSFTTKQNKIKQNNRRQNKRIENKRKYKNHINEKNVK